MPVFTTCSGTGDTALTNALSAPSSGISIVGPVTPNQSGIGAVSFYDGSLAPLSIGSCRSAAERKREICQVSDRKNAQHTVNHS